VAESNEKHRIVNVQQVDNNKPKQKKYEFWKNFDEFVKVNGKPKSTIFGRLLLESCEIMKRYFVFYQPC